VKLRLLLSLSLPVSVIVAVASSNNSTDCAIATGAASYGMTVMASSKRSVYMRWLDGSAPDASLRVNVVTVLSAMNE